MLSMSPIRNGYKKVSILIPTHNRRDLLLQTLQSIAQISVPENVSVEVVVAANACTDDTVDVCRTAAEKFPFPLHCVSEPQVGASYARNRLVGEARGDILAFIDDDVWLDKQWLIGLLDVFNDYPADMVMGKVDLWWKEVAKPSWMNYRTAHLLSCVDYGLKPREIFTAGEVISANMAIHRRVLQPTIRFRTDMDRKGKQVLSGGDTEFVGQLLKAGHRAFYAPGASLLHWVAPERITLDYLSRAAWANGFAKTQMKGALTPLQRFNLTWQSVLQGGFYFVMERLYAATTLEKGRMNNRIRYMTCRGILDALAETKE